MDWLPFVLRLIHIFSALILAGFLLWVNLVQIPVFRTLEPPDRVKIAGIIGLRVLAWMRWSGLVVIASGLWLAGSGGVLIEAMTLGQINGDPATTLLGLGMWTGIGMVAILWFAITPLMTRFAAPDTEPALRPLLAGRAIRLARLNFALLIPLVFAMVAYSHGP